MFLLALPVLGCLALAGIVAVDEVRTIRHAQELRRNAELVDMLSNLTIALEIEAESMLGISEAADMGVDVNALALAFPDEASADQLSVEALYDEVAAQPRTVWADTEAVEDLIAGREAFNAFWTGEADAEELSILRSDLKSVADQAREAQILELDRQLGQSALSAELSDTAHALEPARHLLATAQTERQMLGRFLLPLGPGGSDEENYRELIVANAHYQAAWDELVSVLPPDDRERLLLLAEHPEWQRFEQLRDETLDGDVTPASTVAEPLSLLPIGVIVFIDGFERTHMLSDLERDLSTDFAAGAVELEAKANDRLLRVVSAGLVLALATGLVTSLTIRSINQPVRSLLDRAIRITDGRLDTGRPDEGPSDIDQVHDALDEMTSNLSTVSAQAEALSAGRLDDDVLNQQVVGSLGSSVFGSVARLRSMTARLEHEATHDSLTGLPNRAAVMALLERSLNAVPEERVALAVIMLDLDGFKQANDNWGHLAGDEVLCIVARRLRSRATGHFVARLGGDEFMIILTGAEAGEQSIEVAETVIAGIAEPMGLSCGTLDVSASAGVVVAAADDYLSPSDVLRRVDLALYEAKADSPGEVVRFDQRLHDSLLATAQMAGELTHALRRDEFRLNLQPIVDVGSRDITGYEALIRWDAPLRGPVSPGLFIGVAEQSELITHIDTWVIRRSGEILAEWGRDPSMEHLTLSVNVSARHLSRPDLPGEVAATIERHGLRADRLVIEITESQLIPNLARAEDNLRRLKELGVKLAIDDFGTGYASVAHLRRVEFDRLKIDQSFLAHLADETDRSLATLLVSLGRDLQLEVVAEGIETAAQMAWADGAGCTHAQGYWLGRPQPADSVVDRSALSNPRRNEVERETVGLEAFAADGNTAY
ncbi:MAG: EAL domain-containing protein [Actinomycetota bacterium]